MNRRFSRFHAFFRIFYTYNCAHTVTEAMIVSFQLLITVLYTYTLIIAAFSLLRLRTTSFVMTAVYKYTWL